MKSTEKKCSGEAADRSVAQSETDLTPGVQCAEKCGQETN